MNAVSCRGDIEKKGRWVVYMLVSIMHGKGETEVNNNNIIIINQKKRQNETERNEAKSEKLGIEIGNKKR